MFNSNLPGVFSEIRDGGLSSDVQTLGATTESLLIIGTAVDGPNNIVYSVNNIQDAISLFGHFRNSSGEINRASLIRGAIEALNSGCKDVRLFRIGGTKATGIYRIPNKNYSLYFESKYAGNLYNGAAIKIDTTNGFVYIKKPEVKILDGETIVDTDQGFKTVVYKISQLVPYNNINEVSLTKFISTLNNFVYNNTLTIKIYNIDGSDVTTALSQEVLQLKLTDLNMNNYITIDGGDSGINDTFIKRYMALGGYVKEHTLFDGAITSSTEFVSTASIRGFENSIYDILSNYKIDNLVVMDIAPEISLDIDTIKTSDFEKAYAYIDDEQGLYVEDKTNSASKKIKIAIDTVNEITVSGNDITVKIKEGTTYNEIAKMINTDTNTKDMLYAKGGVKKAEATADFVKISGKLYTTADNFARQLAQACAVISSKTNECIGIIGCTPVGSTDLVSIKQHVDKILGISANNVNPIHVSKKYDLYLKSESGEYIPGSDGKPMDIGGYINIVFGPDLAYVDNVIGVYAVNGAPAYAGLITTLKPEHSTTNKKINGAIGLRYELSGKQLNDLTSAGYVTLRNSYASGIVVTDGVTAAGTGSDFTRLTTKRIISAAINVVRKAAEPFIGLPNNSAERNGLSTAVQAALDAMKAAQAIQDFKFEIYSSKIDQRLGNAVIDLVIVPSFEFRRIRILVNLKNSL